MLIALYIVIVNHLIPTGLAYFNFLVKPTMLIVITMAGLVIIFGAVGFRVSQNLGSTIVEGIFRAIGFVVSHLFWAVGWIVTRTFMLLPRVYNWTHQSLIDAGANKIVSFILSGLAAILVFVIVI
jgi:hypothetical protein